MESIDLWSTQRTYAPASGASAHLSLPDKEASTTCTDGTNSYVDTQTANLPFDDVTLFQSLFPDTTSSHMGYGDWMNSDPMDNDTLSTKASSEVSAACEYRGSSSTLDVDQKPMMLRSSARDHAGSAGMLGEPFNAEAVSNNRDFGLTTTEEDEEIMRYVTFTPHLDLAESKDFGSMKGFSAGVAQTHPNRVVSATEQHEASALASASLQGMDIGVPLESPNLTGDAGSVRIKRESFSANPPLESPVMNSSLGYAGNDLGHESAQIALAEQCDSMRYNGATKLATPYNPYDFEAGTKKSAFSGPDELFNSQCDAVLSYANENERQVPTQRMPASSGLGIYVHTPRSFETNREGFGAIGLAGALGESKQAIVPDSRVLHTTIHGSSPNKISRHWRAQNHENYRPPLNHLKLAERYEEHPEFLGEDSISPVDYESPYMSYSSSSSTDDSYASRMSQENQMRFRHRSISKIPLREIYSMMGLSHDHTKAKWREERIISIAKAEGFDVGNQTWIRDTEETKRARIIDSIREQTKEFGYPPELIEAIVRRGTYARMQSKLRQKRRHNKRSSVSRQIAC